MGMLDAAPASVETEAPETGAEGGGVEATEQVATIEDQEQPRNEAGQFVPVQSKSRRQRAHEAARAEVEQKLTEFQKQQAEENRRFQAELAKRDAEIARMQGFLEAQRGRPAEEAKGPTPAELRRQARQALDQGDFSAYEELSAKATRVEVLQEIEPRLSERSQPQQGPNPVVQAMMAQHPAVLMAGQKGIQLAISQDNTLAALGVPDGPERWNRAFKMANELLGGGDSSFNASPGQRQMLSGTPNGRPAQGSGRGPGVTLTSDEKKWAEAAGMSHAEYAEWLLKSHPERLEK